MKRTAKIIQFQIDRRFQLNSPSDRERLLRMVRDGLIDMSQAKDKLVQVARKTSAYQPSA